MMDKVIKRFDRHAQAYERRGFTNLRMGNLEGALYDYTKSIGKSDKFPEAFYGRGIVHARQGNWAEAAADFKSVTQVSIPHQAIYWQAQVGLGDAYLKLGQPADALRIFNMFVKRRQRIGSLDRYDRRVSHEFAKLLAAAGRHEESFKMFEAALEAQQDDKAPVDEHIHLSYGQALQAAGHTERAREQFKLAGEDFPTAVETLEAAAV